MYHYGFGLRLKNDQQVNGLRLKNDQHVNEHRSVLLLNAINWMINLPVYLNNQNKNLKIEK